MGSALLAPFILLLSAAGFQAPPDEQMRQWIQDLGDDSPQVREAAEAKLVRADAAALSLLLEHAKDDNAERRARIARILKEIRGPEVFKAARGLIENPNAAAWDRVLGLVSALQARLERDLGRAPYERVASAWQLKKLTETPPGAHSLIRSARYGGRAGPAGYTLDSAAVVDGPFESKDGYVNGSVVVVTGDMTLQSYISGSVVLVAGKLKVGRGYVRDSLVIALGGMEIDGYAWGSILGGRVRVSSYVKDCIVVGTLDPLAAWAGELDLRGAQIAKPAILDDALDAVRKPEFVLSPSDVELSKKEEADLKLRRVSKPVRVGLVRIELDSPAKAKKLLEAVGAEVVEIEPDVAASRLSEFQVIYFASGWGSLTGLGDLSETYRTYAKNGGGLLFARPDAHGTAEQAPALKLLPFPVKLAGSPGIGDTPVRIYTPGNPHPLTQGLKAEDLPYPFGSILEADPAWTLLAQGKNSKKASLAAAECGKGRAILHLTLDTHATTYCSERFLVAALEWLARVR